MNSIILSHAEYQQSIKRDRYFKKLTDDDIMGAIMQVKIAPDRIHSDITQQIAQKYKYSYPSDIDGIIKQLSAATIDWAFIDSTLFIAAGGLPHGTYIYRKYAKLKYLFKTKKIDNILNDNDINRVLLDIRVYCTTHLYTFQFRIDDNLKFLNMMRADINELIILYTVIRAMYSADIEILRTNISKLYSVLYGDEYDAQSSLIHRRWFFVANYRMLLIMYKYCEKVYNKLKKSNLVWEAYDNFEFIRTDIENEIADFLNKIVDCVALLKNELALSFAELKQIKMLQKIQKQMNVVMSKYE